MRAAILLAAGWGSRFGRSPKPLALRRGRPLLAHAIAIARAAPAGRLIVVVGRQGERVAAAARRMDQRVTIVRARRWREGLPASLSAGVAALWPAERQAFVLLADMPAVPPYLAARLLRRGAPARATYRGQPGHPVLLDAAALHEVRVRGAFDRRRLAPVPADRRCRFDVDRPRDLRRVAAK